MRTRRPRSRRREQATLFELRETTTTMVHGPELTRAIVDAVAALLLEAARPARPSRSAGSAGGQDDESEDHG